MQYYLRMYSMYLYRADSVKYKPITLVARHSVSVYYYVIVLLCESHCSVVVVSNENHEKNMLSRNGL